MPQDPLVTYSSLIPGVLLYVPGDFYPPPRKRIRYEDGPLEAPSPRSTLVNSPADGIWTRLWKTSAAFFSLALG
jgi:hypothetical protein